MLAQAIALLDKTPIAGHLLVLTCGALVPLSLAPFNWWPIGIVSVLILLVCIDKQTLATRMLRFYLYYVAMFGAGVWWIFVSLNVYGGASPLLSGLLVIILVLGWSLTGLLHGYVYGRFIGEVPFGLLFGFPAIWVFSEWVRSWLLTGFPWLFFGYGHLSSPLGGYGPLVGVLGISFAVMLTATLLYRFIAVRKMRYLFAVIALWVFGFLLHQYDFVTAKDKITVVAVQGNIDQHTKWQRSMVMPILKRYGDLTEPEWGAQLIVWPEAAVTLFRENAGFILDDLHATALENDSTLLLGIPDRDAAGNFLNTALIVGKGTGSYTKRHLVPFGEYIPLEKWLRGIIDLLDLPMAHNSPGEENQPALIAGRVKLSLSICYEVIYPELVRSTTYLPDLLVTISNDTWFGSSIGPAQHLQMAQMRALENGRYLLRATNNGITALVNHKGEIIAALPQFKLGVLKAEAEIMEGVTPFHRFGQSPILILCLSLLMSMVLLRFYNRFVLAE